jgi:hypothetical protein
MANGPCKGFAAVTSDNGHLAHLVIDGVHDGTCGVQGNKLAFRRNRRGKRPETVKGGLLDGRPVRLDTTKDEVGPFWTSRFEYYE